MKYDNPRNENNMEIILLRYNVEINKFFLQISRKPAIWRVTQ